MGYTDVVRLEDPRAIVSEVPLMQGGVVVVTGQGHGHGHSVQSVNLFDQGPFSVQSVNLMAI